MKSRTTVYYCYNTFDKIENFFSRTLFTYLLRSIFEYVPFETSGYLGPRSVSAVLMTEFLNKTEDEWKNVRPSV